MEWSEWGVMVKSKEEARKILRVVRQHNEYQPQHYSDFGLGEELEVSCLLRFRNQAFFCLGNGGGRTLTSNFLAQRLPGTLIYWPFDKPDGWQECRDYLWRPESSVLPQDVPLDKLPLPESTPADDEQQAAPVGADDS